MILKRTRYFAFFFNGENKQLKDLKFVIFHKVALFGIKKFYFG